MRLRAVVIAAIPVPIYETSSVDQVEWILADSGAVGSWWSPAHVAAGRGRADAARAASSAWTIDDVPGQRTLAARRRGTPDGPS